MSQTETVPALVEAPAEAIGGGDDAASERVLPARAEGRLRRFYRRRRTFLRAIVLTLATLVSLIGTIGQFYFVESLEKTAAARGEEMASIETRTETLRSAQNAYYFAQVQSNLIFALNPADRSVNKGVVGDLYSIALIDRGFPFRSILGELAIAGAIDFTTVNDQYNALRNAALADFSYEPYMAVGAFEHRIIEQAMALHGNLQDRYWKASEEKQAAEKAADQRRALLLALAGAATCLFLIANLMGAKD